MRSAKYIVMVMVSLALIAIGCGKKEKEVPTAAESMSKNKKVIIVTSPFNPPFSSGLDTGVQGLDVDLGNEIGKTLNIEVKWVKVKGYERPFELLKTGDAEMVISNAFIDPKKNNEFEFSKPYYETGDVIAHQRAVFNIKDLASLAGKKVGVAKGRFGDEFMATQKTAANTAITKFETLDDALGALNRAELDAVVGDEPIIANSIVKSFQSTTLEPNQVDKYQYGVAVRKGETELLKKINETIDRLQSSGELQKMVQKWVGDITTQAIQRGEADKAEEAKKKAPKAITVSITKTSGAWKMDRLDGFVLVLEGPTGRYQSTPILTEGNRGNCRFTTPVPPGKYRMAFSIVGITAEVTVPDVPKTSLVMNITMGNGATIICK